MPFSSPQQHAERRTGRWLAGAPLAAALAWLGWSKLLVPHRLPLPPALLSERRETNGRAGRMNYYVAGQGAPLVLVHSINAAASAYEMRPIFEYFRVQRRVFAPDLPGFGFSDRSAHAYSPRLYTDAIHDLLDAIERAAGDTPMDAVALSLGAEFVARAATERPERFRSLTLITPTGFGAELGRYGEPGGTRGIPTLRKVLSFPLWARPLFDLLSSRPSIRYFLKQTFGSYAAIDAGLLEYSYLTTHQPDAQHAPFTFVSGLLFSSDIRQVYEAVSQPVWVAYGTRGQFSNFSGTGAVEHKPNWSFQAFETGALPHFERPNAFFTALDAFLATPPVAAGAH